MSASSSPARRADSTAGASSEKSSERAVAFKPPLKPQRKLLRIMSVVVIIWIIAMLTMYFSSVYPQRHGPNAKPEIHESDAPER